MEICAVTGVQISEYAEVVLLPLVQVRKLDRDQSPIWTKGAHCYYEPVLLPLFGKTDSDTVFEASSDDNLHHASSLEELIPGVDVYDLGQMIVQGSKLPKSMCRKGVVYNSFSHVFILRSVWDELGEDSRLARHVETDRNLQVLEDILDDLERWGVKTGDLEYDQVNTQAFNRTESAFNLMVNNPYSGLNSNSFRFYGRHLKNHRDLFRKNNFVFHWMNAFGRLIMPSFSGQARFKQYHVELCQRAYNSMDSLDKSETS